MSRKKHSKEKTNAEDEAAKSAGLISNETLPEQTFEEYQCSGQVEVDFPALCALLDIKEVPAVCIKPPASPASATKGRDTGNNQSRINIAPPWYKPCVQVYVESEDPLSSKCIKISGWKVKEQILGALLKTLPSVSQLLSLRFWQAGLTDPMVISLVNTISLCSSLRVVMLEGNVLPEQSFHLLLSEDSQITYLSLRNNRIGDEGARLIGSALSANKSLTSLSLAFNSIGDAGAAHIAQGLRLNRALCFLSLSGNQIGDSGAAHLAEILGEFALTQEEVVARRKLLLQRRQTSLHRVDSEQSSVDQLVSVSSSTSLGAAKGSSKKKETTKKEEEQAAYKESPKFSKKSTGRKTPQVKGGRSGGKEKDPSAQEDKSSSTLNEAELMEGVNPLLDESMDYRDGKLFLPGNSTLSYLNLAGNRITEKSLPLFLAILEEEGEGGSPPRLCLQRNLFSPQCECYVRISEVTARRFETNSPEPTAKDGQATPC